MFTNAFSLLGASLNRTEAIILKGINCNVLGCSVGVFVNNNLMLCIVALCGVVVHQLLEERAASVFGVEVKPDHCFR